MFNQLPTSETAVRGWSWEQFQPYFDDLLAREITQATVTEWVTDWTRLDNLRGERGTRLEVATTLNTADEEAEKAYFDYIENIEPPAEIANQKLKEKLVRSELYPPGYEIFFRDMVMEAALFREENVPLNTEESKLGTEYDKLRGQQSVMWQGEEKTLSQMKPLQLEPDRPVRESAWRLELDRWLEDREAFNTLWRQFLSLRVQKAKNAGKPDYRAWVWDSFHRFDYTPDDAFRFHEAIEKTAVPAAARLYEKRRQQLGVETLRPWDLDVDPLNHPMLRPYTDGAQLQSVSARIFEKVDPELAVYFQQMRDGGLLDLDNRKNKGAGGYCTTFETARQTFIFMNSVGLHTDVQTLLHEGGHAFHAYEIFANQPAYITSDAPIEFCEVASMSMELIAAPYLEASQGGFYTPAEAARARIEHLESIVQFWPYMAVVDAFQHWAYTHADAATDPAECDAEWSRQWDRFMVGIDYSGLQAEKETGWHRKLHIFQIPFYYIEYGLAQLGAVQVWANSLRDQAQAVRQYRAGLAMGNTATLPKLFEAVGAKFAMDTATLGDAVGLIEQTIAELAPIAAG